MDGLPQIYLCHKQTDYLWNIWHNKQTGCPRYTSVINRQTPSGISLAQSMDGLPQMYYTSAINRLPREYKQCNAQIAYLQYITAMNRWTPQVYVYHKQIGYLRYISALNRWTASDIYLQILLQQTD